MSPAVDQSTSERFFALYDAFNRRDADAVLAEMSDDVAWPNGWEGGYVAGRDAVREYWIRQWEQIDPTVTPRSVDAVGASIVRVVVHQVVRDAAGAVLTDVELQHVYELDGAGAIVRMEIRE